MPSVEKEPDAIEVLVERHKGRQDGNELDVGVAGVVVLLGLFEDADGSVEIGREEGRDEAAKRIRERPQSGVFTAVTSEQRLRHGNEWVR